MLKEIEYQIDNFMYYCENKNLSKKTIASYEATLRLFARYLEDNFSITDAKLVKEKNIKDYIIYTKERGKYTFTANSRTEKINNPCAREDFGKKISTTTVNNYIRNLKVFFNFLVEERVIKTNPLQKIKQFKNVRKAKEQLSDEEFARLIRYLDTTKFHEFRDYIIIQLILDSGMRIGECLALQVENLDIRNNAILIKAENAKSNKDRYVFFSNVMQKMLHRWLQYKDRYVNTEFLFCTNRSTQLAVSNFEKNFRNYVARARITKNITAHSLRNNYARRFLMSGGDIYTLSKILGHSSVTVTEQAYADLSTEDIRKNYRKFSPLENMKGGRR
ncbi:tyrosine-type recombinase/integrase [Clostridium grantii]|uniref:Integrase/recombinase XerD n=1 Tax=Clostridium grantii DSM 8605 TaxID=1121316 RepID=A0A1M5SDV9_9CLOT|nr:tyrosine-type recombinase/integrase [Clostridium grantii]SHH36792.1 integrase/recombinase XerD [Clostridium grantii DSM 8605]